MDHMLACLIPITQVTALSLVSVIYIISSYICKIHKQEVMTWNTSRACEHSSRKICVRFWKKMLNPLNSSSGRQFLEGFTHNCVDYLVFST